MFVTVGHLNFFVNPAPVLELKERDGAMLGLRLVAAGAGLLPVFADEDFDNVRMGGSLTV